MGGFGSEARVELPCFIAVTVLRTLMYIFSTNPLSDRFLRRSILHTPPLHYHSFRFCDEMFQYMITFCVVSSGNYTNAEASVAVGPDDFLKVRLIVPRP
jgi:hypothetical protein